MPSPIPANVRSNLLTGGSNISFPLYEDWDEARIQRYQNMLPDMRAKGLRAVRITMSMNNFENAKTGQLRADRWTRLIVFCRAIIAQGMTPVIDNHNVGLRGDDGVGDWTDQYMEDLNNAGVRTRHTALMTEMVRRLQADATLVNEVVFTFANEPIFWQNPNVWWNYQKQLVPKLRAVGPDVIMTYMANDWNGDQAFISGWDEHMKSFAAPGGVVDPRLIADIHWYGPMAFSHASSTSVKYPGMIPDWRTDDQPELWDKGVMHDLLDDLYQFATAKQLPLVLISEYGAARATDKESRLRYIQDVADLWREFGFGHIIYTWAENDSFKINGVDDRIWAAVTQGAIAPPPPDPDPEPEPSPDLAALRAKVLSLEADLSTTKQQLATLVTRLQALETKAANVKAAL